MKILLNKQGHSKNLMSMMKLLKKVEAVKCSLKVFRVECISRVAQR